MLTRRSLIFVISKSTHLLRTPTPYEINLNPFPEGLLGGILKLVRALPLWCEKRELDRGGLLFVGPGRAVMDA